MKNLGKANVKAEIMASLPYIDKEAFKFNFEVSAYNWNMLQQSPFFSPVLVDQVTDNMDSFAACFPSKRKFYTDNYLVYKDGTTDAPASTNATRPYILFHVTAERKGIAVKQFSECDAYVLAIPGDYENAPSDYTGPKWAPNIVNGIAKPNDTLAISQFYKWLDYMKIEQPPPVAVSPASPASPSANNTATPTSTTTSTTTPNDAVLPVPNLYYLNQQQVKDGLWWAIESEDFLSLNMPFWVNIRRMRSPPSNEFDTCFIISLGLQDSSQSFDIYLSSNNKPVIFDYYLGRDAIGTVENPGPPYKSKQFDLDFSRILDSQEEIEIGVMTIAGRLVVFVNQTPMVYNRIVAVEGNNQNPDDPGTLQEAQIAKGKIKIYGSNVEASINVCPMTFAPLSILALPIPGMSLENNQQKTIVYSGVKNDGTFEGPVCVVPQQPNITQPLYGVDCYYFVGEGGNAYPSGVAFHRRGTMYFNKAKDANMTTLPSSDFYVLLMKPDNTSFTSQTSFTNLVIENGGCPYFFRLKGGASRPKDIPFPDVTLIPEVISATHSMSASDYFQAAATATVTIYNEGGRYDYLRNSQYGIRLSFGWNNKLKKVFTGVIVSASSSEVPGQETLTLQCEDYMTVLKNTPIVNSPFYDGMIAYYAIEDLARRAGITKFIKDWQPSENEYFLSSGYAFSKPAVRFGGKQMLYECIISLVKRFEAFVYFDAEGIFHVKKLPGGLFSDTTGGQFAAYFSRNPSSAAELVIMNEKNTEYNFASTINRISTYTLDRDTRNAIIYTRSATATEDHLKFRKVMLFDQPALGSIDVARTHAERFAKRMFWPIKKISFSTIGSIDSISQQPLILNIFDFIQVDKQEFRLLSISRKYDANSNDFTNEYGCEWLGGAGAGSTTTTTTPP